MKVVSTALNSFPTFLIFRPRVTHCSGNTICQIDKNAFTVLRCCILLYLFLCGSIQDIKKEAEQQTDFPGVRHKCDVRVYLKYDPLPSLWEWH